MYCIILYFIYYCVNNLYIVYFVNEAVSTIGLCDLTNVNLRVNQPSRLKKSKQASKVLVKTAYSY